MKALKHVSAFTANLSINMEPVYGIFLAFIFYHEQKELPSGFFIGTIIILLSVILYMILKYRQHRRNEKAERVMNAESL
jgi:drug/metabolite transporter (DMT)-like permease